MVDISKPEPLIPGLMFEGRDGIKYALNPFANSEINKHGTHAASCTYFCSDCDLTFEDTAEFEHHNVEMHGKRKLFNCDLCNAVFRRQDHLKRHMKSLHQNHKYCYCPVCKKDCHRQDILAKHIKRKHSTNTEVFHCRECQYECTNLSDLEQHEFAHLITDRHQCLHCKTTFKRRDHMLRHVKSQHLNQTVLCPICGQAYKRKDHVARHVREKHRMGLLNGKLVKSTDVL